MGPVQAGTRKDPLAGKQQGRQNKNTHYCRDHSAAGQHDAYTADQLDLRDHSHTHSGAEQHQCAGKDRHVRGFRRDQNCLRSVHSHLETLEKNGYIRRDPTKPRAIEIMDDSFNMVRREVVNVPLIGRVAAGEPILAVENVEMYFPIPAELMPNQDCFLLEVHGESMVEAGIFDGDNILVKQQSTASNGDIVVALVDDSATVKTFYKENGHFRLQPENSSMDPIIVDHVEILGKVFGVMRFFR